MRFEAKSPPSGFGSVHVNAEDNSNLCFGKVERQVVYFFPRQGLKGVGGGGGQMVPMPAQLGAGLPSTALSIASDIKPASLVGLPY